MNSPAIATDSPEISVVIVIGDQRRRAQRAIESVLQQGFDGRLELLVVDMADRLKAEPLGVEDARIRTITVSTSATFGEARASAAWAARAPIVAFLEEHCTALPGWVDALVQAHRGPWAGVGAEVHNANPGVGWSDAMYLMGYSSWMPPAERGETSLTATHNTSYKRALLMEFGDRLADLLTAEPILQEQLRTRGNRLYVEPQARFQHENETSLRSSTLLYWWNRSLGRIRVQTEHSTRLKRLVHLALLPIVPWRRLARLGSYFFRCRRGMIWTLIRQAPRICIIDYVAAAGLALGMIHGTPEDDMRFTELELRGDREER